MGSFWITLTALLGVLIPNSQGQTVGGNAYGNPCVFPFRYKNVLYMSCIVRDHDKEWCSTTRSYDQDKQWGECESEDLANMPYFDLSTPLNVTVSRGDNARLPCVIHKLGNKQITWIKKGQQFPLTVAQFSFFGTDKFTVEREMGDGNRQWNLLIKDVQRKDRGVYMCRVTTRTMLLAREVQLNIKGDPMEITTPSIMSQTEGSMITQQQGMVHVEIALGSRILLQCNSTSQAEVYGERVVLHNFIQWYKDGVKVDSNSRNGIQITNLVEGSLAQSNISIDKAKTLHQGTYYCTSTDKTNAKFSVTINDNVGIPRDEPSTGRNGESDGGDNSDGPNSNPLLNPQDDGDNNSANPTAASTNTTSLLCILYAFMSNSLSFRWSSHGLLT